MRLVFNVVGDRDGIEPLANSLGHAGGRPDLAVGKDCVHVKVTLKGFVVEYIREVDLGRVYGKRRYKHIGKDGEQCDSELSHLEGPFLVRLS
ncbi:MAG: hypothetical protein ACYTE3_31140, partial [Planctomycetota bacterium]